MSHFRYSKIKDKWVIIAPERANRPNAVSKKDALSDSESPFIYGNEHLTPPETFSIRPRESGQNKDGWLCRTVPNKFHALGIEQDANPFTAGFFEGFGGFGAHEVVIDTPYDTRAPHRYTKEEWTNILISIKVRILGFLQDNRFKYVSVFKNHGPNAGATIAHPHTQILAIPMIPTDVTREIEVAREYFAKTGRTLFIDEINEELKEDKRVIFENSVFGAFCPYASAFPFEVRIGPKYKIDVFERCDESVLWELSDAIAHSLQKLDMALGSHSYNILFKLHPLINEHREPNYFYKIEHFFRWYVEITPRLYNLAGFELSSGVNINPIEPESAANYLKERH